MFNTIYKNYIYVIYRMIFECDKCGKIITKKDTYIKHINRKTTCMKQDNPNYDITKSYEKLQKEHKKLQKEYEEIKKEHEEVKKERDNFKKQLIDNKPSVSNGNIINGSGKQNINNIVNNNTVNNITIIIPHGHESLDFFTGDEAFNIINKGYSAPANLVKLLHFSEKFKENHNVYISNFRTKKAHVYDGSIWKQENAKKVVENIIDTCNDAIIHEADIICKKLKEKTHLLVKKYVEDIEKPDVVQRVFNDIHTMLFEHKHIVKNTIKELKTNL